MSQKGNLNLQVKRLNAREHLERALRWFGPLVLCLMVACSSKEGSEGGESAERGFYEVEPVDGGNVARDSQPPERSTHQFPNVADDGKENGRDSPSANDSAYDILDNLKSLSWDAKEPDLEQAEYLLRRLRSQGARALIPIRDILLNRTSPDAVSPELRLALLDVLLSLGIPEVEGVAVDLLAARPSALETWHLGKYLAAYQPGKYTDSIRTAAEQALIEPPASEELPGEFFLFLAEMGNEETALLLAELPMYQEAYGTMALPAIPDGAGLPLLAQDARAFEAGQDTVKGRLAIQLLAQEAPQFPEAATVLIELAEQGVIPHDLWPFVLDIVAGNWELTMIEPPPHDIIGSHTYYHPDGDQIIYRAVLHQGGLDHGLQSQRLFLLDRLQPLTPPELWPGSNG